MAYFKWSDEFDVKVDRMNDQHKSLIALMDELYQLSEQHASKREILHKLDNLLSFTRKHFHEEELYMDAIQYNDRERHKIIHQHLLAELEQHKNYFMRHHVQLSEDFFYFLRHWLTSHIKHIDIKYGKASEELELARAI